MLNSILRRIQLDYFLKNRLGDLSFILDELAKSDYQILSVIDFVDMIERDACPDKICIMRIDVDSDPRLCLDIAKTLKQHACGASFYFRLLTIDQDVMRKLGKDGFEVGYHFEELATVAKRLGIKDAQDLHDVMPMIRDEFKKNLDTFSEILGYRPKTVASHGDFANRKLGVTNSVIVDDDVRKSGSLVAETYDETIVSQIDVNLIDTGPPAWWSPEHPLTAADKIEGERRRIRILIHPKHWQSNACWNARHTLSRIYEGLLYKYAGVLGARHSGARSMHRPSSAAPE